MAQRRPRPLSPHLTIWRWGPMAIVSIVHRISGVGLSIVGTLTMVWFLCAVAAGPRAYATFAAVWSTWLGQAVLFGLTWALFQHMLSGIRHLFMDAGAGYHLSTARRSALIVFAGAFFLTICFWGWILLRG